MQPRSKTELSTWRTLAPLARRFVLPHWPYLLGGIAFGVLSATAAGFGLPFMIQHVFPLVFGEQPPKEVATMLLRFVSPEQLPGAIMWGAALILPCLMLVRGLATFFNTYLLTKAGMMALVGLRRAVFARLQWLSFSYHDKHKRGAMMASVLQYTQMLQSGMISISNDLVIQPLTLIAALSYVIYAALKSNESAILLGNILIAAAVIPLVRWVGKRLIAQMQKAMTGITAITSTVEETFSAQREVRAFNLEEQQSGHLKGLIRKYNHMLLMMAVWKQFLGPAIEIVSALALSYALYRGCSDGLTLEQFSAIAMAFYFCYDPVKKLGDITNQSQVIGVCARGLRQVLEAKDETPDPAEPLPLPAPVKGAVRFKHVHFGYHKAKMVLKDINVAIPAGQIVALVGPSGSGKTTFINLICRFYDVRKGAVCIDGVDVRKLTRRDRTGAIGLVSQFSALFCDTIAENIRVGRPGATDAQVEEAGRRARVSEFADLYPEGYRHLLTESGGGLSGGQRQRVSIARAFLKNAPILILDEATSALDVKSEALIQQSLEDLAQGHTTFIIAHRFSTIRMAQRILVFEGGRIIGDGTHKKLYESCDLYRHLYDEQTSRAGNQPGKGGQVS